MPDPDTHSKEGRDSCHLGLVGALWARKSWGVQNIHVFQLQKVLTRIVYCVQGECPKNRVREAPVSSKAASGKRMSWHGKPIGFTRVLPHNGRINHSQ